MYYIPGQLFYCYEIAKHKINLNFWRFKKENTWSYCNFLIKQKILILIENIKCNFHDANVRTFWDSKEKILRVCIYAPSFYRSKTILLVQIFLSWIKTFWIWLKKQIFWCGSKLSGFSQNISLVKSHFWYRSKTILGLVKFFLELDQNFWTWVKKQNFWCGPKLSEFSQNIFGPIEGWGISFWTLVFWHGISCTLNLCTWV